MTAESERSAPKTVLRYFQVLATQAQKVAGDTKEPWMKPQWVERTWAAYQQKVSQSIPADPSTSASISETLQDITDSLLISKRIVESALHGRGWTFADQSGFVADSAYATCLLSDCSTYHMVVVGSLDLLQAALRTVVSQGFGIHRVPDICKLLTMLASLRVDAVSSTAWVRPVSICLAAIGKPMCSDVRVPVPIDEAAMHAATAQVLQTVVDTVLTTLPEQLFLSGEVRRAGTLNRTVISH